MMNKRGLKEMLHFLMSVNGDLEEFNDLTIAVVMDDVKLRIRKNYHGVSISTKPLHKQEWVEPDGY